MALRGSSTTGRWGYLAITWERFQWLGGMPRLVSESCSSRATCCIPSPSEPQPQPSLSPGVGGTRNEHLKLAFEDEAAWGRLREIAERLARADVPGEIAAALRMCHTTALVKAGGKIRGTSARDSFPRLVARTLAQQFAQEFCDATSPYNFELASHSGREAIVHVIRALTDENPDLVLTKIDGIGAFDHALRPSKLEGLLRLPTAHRLLPHMRTLSGTPGHHAWIDDAALLHDIRQGEGGEQGDPLMLARGDNRTAPTAVYARVYARAFLSSRAWAAP